MLRKNGPRQCSYCKAAIQWPETKREIRKLWAEQVPDNHVGHRKFKLRQIESSSNEKHSKHTKVIWQENIQEKQIMI